MGLLPALAAKKIRISQIQDGGQPSFYEPLHHRISATFWLIFIKFGTVMHVGFQSLA